MCRYASAVLFLYFFCARQALSEVINDIFGRTIKRRANNLFFFSVPLETFLHLMRRVLLHPMMPCTYTSNFLVSLYDHLPAF